jgi:hypothetical protein
MKKLKDTSFVKVDKELIGEVKLGEVFGLEVVEIGEQITLKLKRIQETEEDNERVGFYEVFKEIEDGLENIVVVQISGIKFGANCRIGKGITFGGINFQLFKGRDLLVIKQPNYWTVVGIY